jgi:DNA repair exonuclease SbcCD ATPase subunit
MPPATVPEAEAELSRAITLEQVIKAELDQLRQELTETERTVGDRSLEARKAGDSKQIKTINDELSKLQTRHSTLSKTHQAARDAIKTARHELNMARGQVLRAQAAELIKQVQARQAKTDELLTALYKHEGVHYLPEAQTRGGVCLAGSFAESNTAKIMIEAKALIRQAETMENQVVRVEPEPLTTGRKSKGVPV